MAELADAADQDPPGLAPLGFDSPLGTNSIDLFS